MTDSPPEGKIVSRLAEVMIERRLGVTELAKIAGVSRPTIYDLRANRSKAVRMSTIAKLCSALKCGVGVLLYHQPNHDPDRAFMGTDES